MATPEDLAPPSEEGLVEVIITFDPFDMARNGSRTLVPADKAAVMVAESRAVYADAAPPPEPPPDQPEPE